MRAHPLRWIRNQFLRDAATLQLGGMLSQVSQLASAVLVAYLLGSHDQGRFQIAIALQGLLYFMISLGVVPATVSQIAAATARGNHFKTAGWIAFMAKAAGLVSVLILVAGWFVLPHVGDLFYDDHLVGEWALLLTLGTLLELPRLVAAVAFQGTRRMLPLAQVENAHEVVRLFLVVLGALVTGSPAGAVYGMAASGAFGSTLAVELYRRARHDGGPPLPGVLEIARRIPEIPLWRGMRMGLRISLLKNGSALFLTIFPRLLIGGVVSASYATYFHIADRILSVPMMLLLGVSRTAMPALGQLAGLRDVARFRRLFWRVTLIAGGLVGGAMLLCLPFVKMLVGLLFPTSYVEPTFHFALILALGYVPFAFGAGLESFYIATNKLKTQLWITVVGAAVTIPTNVWLILNVVPYGTAWGMSFYQSWVLVHLAFIGVYLSRRRESFWIAPASEGGPGAGPGAGPGERGEERGEERPAERGAGEGRDGSSVSVPPR